MFLLRGAHLLVLVGCLTRCLVARACWLVCALLLFVATVALPAPFPSPRKKPPVPRREDRPTMGLHCAKNFVTSNAVEAILAVPSNRRQPPIDYLKKEDFGRVPVREEKYRSHGARVCCSISIDGADGDGLRR